MRGIDTVIFNDAACTASNLTQWDTFISPVESADLASYLARLMQGTWVFGISEDSADLNLNPVNPELDSLGVNVDNLQYREKLIFIIQIGNLNETVVKYGLPNTPHLSYQQTF